MKRKRLRTTYEKWFQDVLPPSGFKRLPLPASFHYGEHGYAWDWDNVDGAPTVGLLGR